MPIKRIKDKTHLISKLNMPSGFTSRYYWHAYLWADQAALVANTHGMEGGDCRACCIPNKWTACYYGGRFEVKPMLGELHFIKDGWNLMIVAHEVQHAIIHRMRVLVPFVNEVAAQDEITGGGYRGASNTEELICYETGRWTDDLYNWLWDANPYGKNAKGGKYGTQAK